MTPKEFAELIGIIPAALERLEEGSLGPSVDRLRILLGKNLVPENDLQSAYHHFFDDPARYPNGLPPLTPLINNPVVGNWLAEVRGLHAMTQQEFAGTLGIQWKTLRYWESGEEKPSREQLGYLLDRNVAPKNTMEAAFQKFYKNPHNFPGGLPPLVPEVHNPIAYPSFGTWLTDIREQHNMARKEFAELIGSDEKSVRSWEMNTRNPTVQILPAVRHAAGISVDMFRTALEHFSRARAARSVARN
ncbi:helix-turn-helix transcriptional regulator [Nocardia jinanensis]|uniref:HTH cro/C1-type domain-containing protein n=1 Tax=Nocardia jinanensis TaxID=382504 RepID=A0A917VTB9_9NOCA|nr:helix-turn-helix transcriptional regulator [Nocardia jinanensis]GGL12175.1 hypothetical protein GCM10011588_28170 [Nocardia jinanensis]